MKQPTILDLTLPHIEVIWQPVNKPEGELLRLWNEAEQAIVLRQQPKPPAQKPEPSPQSPKVRYAYD